jgi:hypothetical protein
MQKAGGCEMKQKILDRMNIRIKFINQAIRNNGECPRRFYDELNGMKDLANSIGMDLNLSMHENKTFDLL